MTSPAITKFLKEGIDSGKLKPVFREGAERNPTIRMIKLFPAILDKDGRAKPDMASIPVRLGRHDAAAFISQFFFPVSGRTLERWNLKKQLASGRTLYLTVDLVNQCQIRLAMAPAAGKDPKKQK
jgi:hypothetical protein